MTGTSDDLGGGDVIEEQPAGDTEPTSPTAAEGGAIGRRTAMKAALGGAVAAAAWTAPRIEHLSVAPDFAQAATCLPTTGTVTRTSTVCDFGLTGFTSECYGNCIGSLTQDCGTAVVTYPSAGNTVSGQFPVGVTMEVTYSGFAEGSVAPGQGTASIRVIGIRSPRQTCNVVPTHTGCTNFFGQPGRPPNSVSPTTVGPYTSTSAGPRTMNMGCYNNLGSNSARVTLTLRLACTCA